MFLLSSFIHFWVSIEGLTNADLQAEQSTANDRITNGLDAIVLGKWLAAKKSDKEPGFDKGVGFNEIQKDETEFEKKV